MALQPLHSSNMIKFRHYQKFAKYQRISRRNIFCRYFEVEITDGHFSSVIQSVKTDEKFSVCNSVGKYRRKISVGIYRLNYGRKSFWILKKVGRWRGGFGGLFFSDGITDGFKNYCPYSARKVMWPVCRLNFRRTHRGIWNGRSVRWHVYVSVRITGVITDGVSVCKTVGKS
jgi:hypothetical protein